MIYQALFLIWFFLYFSMIFGIRIIAKIIELFKLGGKVEFGVLLLCSSISLLGLFGFSIVFIYLAFT